VSVFADFATFSAVDIVTGFHVLVVKNRMLFNSESSELEPSSRRHSGAHFCVIRQTAVDSNEVLMFTFHNVYLLV
jgi:hypothetical protein